MLNWLIGSALVVVAVAVAIEVVRDLYSRQDEVREVSPVVVLGQTLPPFDESLDDPAVGLAAPGFSASTFDEVDVSVEPWDGTPKVIAFFAHWCLECKRELPRLSNWLQRRGLPEGVEVMAVSTAVIPDRSNYPPSKWFVDTEWPAITVRDSEYNSIGEAYGLTGFPFTVVLDGRGRVVTRVSGVLTDSQWESLLAAAVGAEA